MSSSFRFIMCHSTSLPSQSVLTSWYTHPLPQCGEAHRDLTRGSNRSTLSLAHTCKHAETHNLPDCPETSKHAHFVLKWNKDVMHCWERGGYTQTPSKTFMPITIHHASEMLRLRPRLSAKKDDLRTDLNRKDSLASEWAGRSIPTTHPIAFPCCTHTGHLSVKHLEATIDSEQMGLHAVSVSFSSWI